MRIFCCLSLLSLDAPVLAPSLVVLLLRRKTDAAEPRLESADLEAAPGVPREEPVGVCPLDESAARGTWIGVAVPMTRRVGLAGVDVPVAPSSLALPGVALPGLP